MDKEKRRAPRVKSEKAMNGRLKLTVPVTIRDVSVDGLRLELSSALRPGSLYDLRADLNGTPLVAQLRITRCSAGGFSTDASGSRVLQYNAGAEFAQLDAEQRKVLQKWIEKAVPEPAHRPASGTISRLEHQT